MGMGNKLKTRFVASAAFSPMRKSARDRLVQLWFESGRAEQITRELSAIVPRVGKLDEAAMALETQAVITKLGTLAKTAKAAEAPPK